MATRFLVIILLLANMLLFGIKLSGDMITVTPVMGSSASIFRPNAPMLRLLAEVPAGELQNRSIKAQCFTIGPMQSSERISKLKSSLADLVSEPQERSSFAKISEGFLVYTTPSRSRAQALEYARELGDMGLTDYFVITSTSLNNSISLGLYNDEHNARMREQALRALGINARILAMYKSVEEYWLDYRIVNGNDPPQIDLKEFVPDTLISAITCPAGPEETVAELIATAK